MGTALTTEELDALIAKEAEEASAPKKDSRGDYQYVSNNPNALPEAGLELAEKAVSSAPANFLRGTGDALIDTATGLFRKEATPELPGPAYAAGKTTGRVLPTVLAPAKIAYQGAVGGVEGFMQPASGLGERFANAGKGAALYAGLQAGSTLVVKGVNRALGRTTEDAAVYDAAKKRGVDLTFGDIRDNNLMRTWEELSIGSPSRKQAAQIEKMLTKNGTTENAIVDDVFKTYDDAAKEVTNAYQALNAAGATKSGAAPYATANALDSAVKDWKFDFSGIKNNKSREILDEMLGRGTRAPQRRTFDELDQLRRSLGARPTLTKEQQSGEIKNMQEAWGKVYSAVLDDMNAIMGADAHLLGDAATKFQEKVLPYRQIASGAKPPLSLKIINGEFEGNPRALIAAIQRSSPEEVGRLSGLMSDEGRDILAVALRAKTGTTEYAKESALKNMPSAFQTAVKMIPYGTAAATAGAGKGMYPAAAFAVLAGEQAIPHLLNLPPIKNIALGSPNISKSGGLDAVAQMLVRAGGASPVAAARRDNQERRARHYFGPLSQIQYESEVPE